MWALTGTSMKTVFRISEKVQSNNNLIFEHFRGRLQIILKSKTKIMESKGGKGFENTLWLPTRNTHHSKPR